MRERSWGHWRTALRRPEAAADAEQEMFARQVAGAMQARERTDPTFADRVMRAVRDDARASGQTRATDASRSPARRPVLVRVTPLRGLALAASLTALYAAAEFVRGRPHQASQPHVAAAQRDTVHVVRFVFVAPGVSSVAVVGDFNRWDLGATPLAPAASGGVWSASVQLPSGRHEYVFVIDGKRWVADPTATSAVPDEFGGESSTITVGRLDGPRTS